MTTPPTAADTDTWVAANWSTIVSNATAEGSKEAFLQDASGSDAVFWIVAYTDNAANPHYESLGLYGSGVVGATDAQLEANTPISSNFPLAGDGARAEYPSLPYINALIEAYGSVLLRGYLVPGIPWPPGPVDSAVQTWVNDSSNWAAAG